MTRTPTWLTRLALLCLPFFLSGCLDYREILTLSSTGGGSLEAELTLDLGLLRELSAALGEAVAPGDLASPTRAELEATLEAEGVELSELSLESQGPRTWARFRIEFEDLDALHRIEAFASRRQLAVFEQGPGQVLLVSRCDLRGVVPLPGFGQVADPVQAQVVADVVERIRASLRLESELRLPGQVLSCNGELVGAGREVRWHFDPLQRPELGQEEALLKATCDASALPWASELQPTPPEAGEVEADALAPVTSSTQAAASGAPASPAQGVGLQRRGGEGCALGAGPGSGASAALWLALCGAGLLFLRRRAVAGPRGGGGLL